MSTRKTQFRNSVFIAYHGSKSIDGTGKQAEEIAKRLKKSFPVSEPYYGPDTDERTYDVHPDVVIPGSAMFLLVVNDRCPKDEYGKLDKTVAAWLYREVQAFYDLFANNERSKKDFAVYYCGNLLRTNRDIAAYVKRLLSDIDKDGALCEGNQYYVVDSIGIDDWVQKRLVDPHASVLTDEPYYPFDLLREKVKNVLDAKPKDVFVLQMERGMGKTTFAHALENDDEFRSVATVRALFIDRDKNYASPEKFLWDFSDLLRRDDNGTLRSVEIMPVDILNSDPVRSFTRFVNEFKAKYYADTKLLIIIDGIDDMGVGGTMTVTDFFEKAEFADGIYVMFSCRIFDDADCLRNAAYGFIKRFDGEKITFDSKNYDYLKFLYDYYNDNLITQFPKNGGGISVRKIFESIDPKNILAFSILIKIGNIYLGQTDAAKVDWHILSSLEHALGFFYKHMKSTLNVESFAEYKKLLVIFALSDLLLTEADLKEAFGIDFSAKTLRQNPYLRIFIRLHDETEPVSFGIVHDRIKQLILSDDPDFTKALVDEIYAKTNALAHSGMSMDELCGKRFAVLKFSGTLFDSEFLTQDEKNTLAENLLSLPFEQNWSKPVPVAESERSLLKMLTDYIKSPTSTIPSELSAETALAYAVYAHDCFILNLFYEAGEHFATCCDYYDKAGLDRATPKVKQEYAMMLTVYGTHLQLCNKPKESLALFVKCLDLCDKLFAEHNIPLRDYVHYHVAKSNIYNSCKDYASQKKTLDTAMRIGGDEYRETDPARYAFMNTGYASYYDAKHKPKKAFKYIQTALAHYKIHYARDWTTMFIGDMVACVGNYVARLPQIYKNRDVCLTLMHKETDFIRSVVNKTGYSNPNIDMRVHMNVARFYLDLRMKKECITACTGLLDRISAMLAGKARDFVSVRNFKSDTEAILDKAKRLPD